MRVIKSFSDLDQSQQNRKVKTLMDIMQTLLPPDDTSGKRCVYDDKAVNAILDLFDGINDKKLFKINYAAYELEKQKLESERIIPMWRLPSVLFLLNLMQSSVDDGLCSAPFQESIMKCFIKTGCASGPKLDKIFEQNSETATAGAIPSTTLAPSGTTDKFENNVNNDADIVVDITDLLFEYDVIDNDVSDNDVEELQDDNEI